MLIEVVDGKEYEVIPVQLDEESNDLCVECAFYFFPKKCISVECECYKRDDFLDVIFKEVKSNE